MNSQFDLEISGLQLTTELLGKDPSVTKNLLVSASDFFLKDYFSSLDEEHRFTCHLKIVDSEEIQTLNREYRDKDKATDVLSFPVMDDLRNQPELLRSFKEIELGDVFICWDVLVAQATEFELQNWEELLHLYIHGFLHLTGFDHEISASEQKLMEDWENKILQHSSDLLSH